MTKKERCMGSTIVEAAILFPLILGLTMGGFFLMTHWYSQWEEGMETHQELMDQREVTEHLKLLHWEQWGTLLEDGNESE